MSRIGRKPIDIPENIKVEIKDGIITVRGAQNELRKSIHPRIKAEVKNKQIIVTRPSDS